MTHKANPFQSLLLKQNWQISSEDILTKPCRWGKESKSGFFSFFLFMNQRFLCWRLKGYSIETSNTWNNDSTHKIIKSYKILSGSKLSFMFIHIKACYMDNLPPKKAEVMKDEWIFRARVFSNFSRKRGVIDLIRWATNGSNEHQKMWFSDFKVFSGKVNCFLLLCH